MFSNRRVLKKFFVLQIFLLQNIFTRADKDVLFLNNNSPEIDVPSDFILPKDYLTKDHSISKTAAEKNGGNDLTYLLTKLSAEELVKLLRVNPKKTELNLNDIVNFAAISNNLGRQNEGQDNLRSRFRTVAADSKTYTNNAFFKLDNKPVKPNKHKGREEEEAIFRIKNILYSRPLQHISEDDKKKQIIFEILVSQLKTLCCKKSPRIKPKKPRFLQPLLTDFTKNIKKYSNKGPTNFMFLIINDDIPRNVSHKEGLISVDPDSLDEKSSVLLLGPILQELNNVQLKNVMNKITEEISRPEYLPLLQQIADGYLDPDNMKLMKSLVTGPDTRRYIKPHRCNYQSKLARVLQGPRWIICTGYLNRNSPGLYD